MMEVRLIRDPPAAGSWNMAVDEALLHSAADSRLPTLRFYTWQQPTLSLGYFQRYADRDRHTASLPCPVVRRSTGGGAILHHLEVTYCLAVPLSIAERYRTQHWYHVVHGALIATLAAWGLPAAICSRTDPRRENAFLCFQRRARGDVLVDGVKVAGSAQRRSARALLQHGSVLLSRSPAAPELPGLQQLLARPCSATRLIVTWLAPLAHRLGASWQAGQLTDEELERSHCIARERFNAQKWTHKRD